MLVFELKVTLDSIKPPIWRAFQVPAEITFARLHKVLQIVMGWKDYHLFVFKAGKECIGIHSDWDGNGKIQDSGKIKLSEVLHLEGQKVTYVYDFGDNWQHTVEVVKIIAGAAGFKNILCTGGQRACPPEDCGSCPGYMEIIEQLKLPAKQRDPDMLDWLEENYDPEFFDIEEVNRRLSRLKVQ